MTAAQRRSSFDPVEVGQQETAAWAAYVYGVPRTTMRRAAQLRAEAIELSDAWVAAGCRRDDPLLAAERRTLIASYPALRESVERNADDLTRSAGAGGSS